MVRPDLGELIFMNVGTIRAGLQCAGLATSIFAPAQAQQAHPLPGTFSGNVTFVSDYIVRGYSSSDEGPAVAAYTTDDYGRPKMTRPYTIRRGSRFR